MFPKDQELHRQSPSVRRIQDVAFVGAECDLARVFRDSYEWLPSMHMPKRPLVIHAEALLFDMLKYPEPIVPEREVSDICKDVNDAQRIRHLLRRFAVLVLRHYLDCIIYLSF